MIYMMLKTKNVLYCTIAFEQLNLDTDSAVLRHQNKAAALCRDQRVMFCSQQNLRVKMSCPYFP